MHANCKSELGKALDTPLFPDTLPGITPTAPKPSIASQYRPATKAASAGTIPITVIAVIATLSLVTFAFMSMVGK